MKSFESSEETKTRTDEERRRIQSGVLKEHNHVGNLRNYSLDLAACLRKVIRKKPRGINAHVNLFNIYTFSYWCF